MTRQEEIDLAVKKAAASLPRGPRQREIDKGLAKWRRENPKEDSRYRPPRQGAAR